MSKRVPALDGVRGIAILAVFCYHATHYAGGLIARLGGFGWMGVDLFFVLSGYLITGILLDTVARPHYYRTFYWKRARRIVPAFVLFMVVLLFVAPLTGLMRPAEHAALVARQGYYWTYLVNVLLARHGWEWPVFETGHLWSLAVEEQFYLVWPFVIAWARTPRRALHVALAVIVAVTLTRIVAVRTGTDALSIYVLPPFRADALAWGAMLAAAMRVHGDLVKSFARPLTFAGLALLAAVILRLHDANNPSPSMQILGYPAVSMLAAGLIAWRPHWLAWHPFRVAGKYSYAFYLWHTPILLVLSRSTTLPWPLFLLAGFIATSAAALLSWWLVESPAMRVGPVIHGSVHRAHTVTG